MVEFHPSDPTATAAGERERENAEPERRKALADEPCPGGYEHEFTVGFHNSAGSTYTCDHCPAVRHHEATWAPPRRPWNPVHHGEPPEYRQVDTVYECAECHGLVADRDAHTAWHHRP